MNAKKRLEQLQDEMDRFKQEFRKDAYRIEQEISRDAIFPCKEVHLFLTIEEIIAFGEKLIAERDKNNFVNVENILYIFLKEKLENMDSGKEKLENMDSGDEL